MGNNILIKIKRFFQNKNTVTIICVLAGILVLYIGYNWRVGSATEPISIPYAKNTLSSRHTITREDIGYVEVASTVLEKMPNIIRNSAQLIGKEVIYGNTIQMNSFFYNEDITDAEKNIVYLGKNEDNFKTSLTVRDLKLSYPPEKEDFDAMVKIRYNMKAQKAKVTLSGSEAEIKFYEPVSSVTSGQAGVFYDINDGHLIGGGRVR